MTDESLVTIPVDSLELSGTLVVPKPARGLIIFAHGSGSSRLSPRNQFVAGELQRVGLATLLFDLLTEEEDATYENRFNIALLRERLVAAVRWVHRQDNLQPLPLGFFGASTGAAAALEAAAELGADVRAVVSRGGRPDLALPVLPQVTASTLLIVGGDDIDVIELNRQALAALTCEKKLEIVPGATHLFEEPGALETVAQLAAAWFGRYLVTG